MRTWSNRSFRVSRCFPFSWVAQFSQSYHACGILSRSGWRDMKDVFKDLGPPLWSHVAVPLRMSVAQFFDNRIDVFGLDAVQVAWQPAFVSDAREQSLSFRN